MALKTWDQYVKDADREPQVLAVSDTETLTLTMPSTTQVEEFNAASFKGDTAAALAALLGDSGKRIAELGATAPAGALNEVTNDILVGFGLRPGNSATSSS